jgi:hypothetical protein
MLSQKRDAIGSRGSNPRTDQFVRKMTLNRVCRAGISSRVLSRRRTLKQE